MSQGHKYTDEEAAQLACCTICPRECGVNRLEGEEGYCKTDAFMNVASVCIHRGEEPPISGPDGICNVFFAGCNMRCRFCQNHEISRGDKISLKLINRTEEVIEKIVKILDSGINAVGFVSPSHVVPQVKVIIRELNANGYHPVTVFNTGGFDKASTIDSLEGLIDVYLPDLKYHSAELASSLSDAPDYHTIAIMSLKRMYYQKGSVLKLDNAGNAESGILVRHLVLPGHSDDSIKVLQSIAEEISPGVSISLMSQYSPIGLDTAESLLFRTITVDEYTKVVNAMVSLGFRNGYFQDMDSHKSYKPDFSMDHPFEY